jgi:hypothetical protein
MATLAVHIHALAFLHDTHGEHQPGDELVEHVHVAGDEIVPDREIDIDNRVVPVVVHGQPFPFHGCCQIDKIPHPHRFQLFKTVPGWVPTKQEAWFSLQTTVKTRCFHVFLLSYNLGIHFLIR